VFQLTFSHVALLILACTLVLLAFRLARVQARSEQLLTAMRQTAERTDREMSDLRRRNGLLQQDQQFLAQFLRDLPHLSRELHSGSTERQIPRILLNIVMRTLAPRQALVLIRRRNVETDPQRGSRLIVAAAGPHECGVKLGTEIEMGKGMIGFSAETQRVMARADFEGETAIARARFAKESHSEFEPDLAAPLVFEEQTLGVIALSRPTRTSEDAKAALRLVAQTGAQALHNAAAYTQIKHTAERDGLTRVFNKRQLTQTLSELIYEASQRVGALSVFLFDLDNFKNYNDVNGHVAGDKLLQLLARLVQENVRKQDVLGRFGGEEFLLIFPETRLPQALGVAEKIRWVISSHAFPHAQRQPLGCVSISGGVAEFPGDAQESTALLRSADRALYEAKRQGRNRVLPAARGYLSDREPEIADSADLASEGPEA
jgi:diguanylate cyclase (GGDEF)-like protein